MTAVLDITAPPLHDFHFTWSQHQFMGVVLPITQMPPFRDARAAPLINFLDGKFCADHSTEVGGLLLREMGKDAFRNAENTDHRSDMYRTPVSIYCFQLR